MSGATHITVRVPMSIMHRPGRKTVVTPVALAGVPAVPTRADPALVKALARAFRYQRMLDEGRYASISDIARAEKLDRTYVGDILRLTLLAPWVVEAIVEGRQGEDVTLPGLMKPFSIEWHASARACEKSPHPQQWSRSLSQRGQGRIGRVHEYDYVADPGREIRGARDGGSQ